jgi:tetratricopeptide (TPR) repeat protein
LRGDHAAAAAQFAAALAADPGSRELQYRLGRSLLFVGELAQARGFLESVRESRPEDPAVLESLSRVYRELGAIEPCIEVNFARLQRDPKALGPYLEILDPLVAAQRFEDAFVLFSRAVDIYGLGGFYFLRTAGEMALKTDRPLVALGYLTKAQRLAPRLPELDELILRARQQLGSQR